MTSLGTAILLTLTTLFGVAALACDSNPTPHPGHSKGDQGDAYAPNVGGGEVTGTELPPDRNDPDDDLDPNAPTDEATGGAAENCVDADASDSADAANFGDDDNETRVSGDAGDPDEAEDCEGDATPIPGAAGDYDQVEGSRAQTPSDSHRPSRAP